MPGAGHYGIFSGRRWRQQVYPRVKAFIAENSPPADATHTATATKLGASAAKRGSEARKAA